MGRKEVNLFSHDKIFCPRNLNDANFHWTLIVIRIQEKRIECYDSGGSPGYRDLSDALQYVEDEAQRSNITFDRDEWALIPNQASTPRQKNGYDCGAFVIMAADYMTDNLDLTYTQDNMRHFRKKICANILRGKLKYPLYNHHA
jgi:sentrin-specific protease 1